MIIRRYVWRFLVWTFLTVIRTVKIMADNLISMGTLAARRVQEESKNPEKIVIIKETPRKTRDFNSFFR